MLSKIDSFFTTHDKSRITQGDLLRDFEVPITKKTEQDYVVELMTYPFLIVMSQDCDLEQCSNTTANGNKNAFLANILVLPAFLAQKIQEGNAFIAYGIAQDSKATKEMNKIKGGKEARYFYISENEPLKIPELIIDFKHYLTIPKETVELNYNEKYCATINELFRENLARKFANYLSRIGLPVI